MLVESVNVSNRALNDYSRINKISVSYASNGPNDCQSREAPKENINSQPGSSNFVFGELLARQAQLKKQKFKKKNCRLKVEAADFQRQHKIVFQE